MVTGMTVGRRSLRHHASPGRLARAAIERDGRTATGRPAEHVVPYCTVLAGAWFNPGAVFAGKNPGLLPDAGQITRLAAIAVGSQFGDPFLPQRADQSDGQPVGHDRGPRVVVGGSQPQAHRAGRQGC